MKKKSIKSNKIEQDVEMVDNQVSKSKKRSSTTENLAPKEKKPKIENPKTKTKNDKEQRLPQTTKTETKSYKQEAEEAKEKKRLRKIKEKKFYEVREEIKKLWEDLRKMDLESTKRVKVTNEMYKLVEGKAVHLVFAHDTSRCIQSLVKFGSAQQRDAIFKELKGSFLKMMKSKFAKFCVRKFIKYGSKAHREEIFKVFQGNVAVLLKHKEASDIIELAYNDYANVQHRNSMEQEFYGPIFLVTKTEGVKGLVSFKKEFPDKINVVVQHMKEKLLSLIEKSILQLSFVHKLLFDFFQVADDTSLSELIESLKDHTAHLVHTKNGSRVAMRCLWFGTAKERKAIVKSMKGLVLKMAQEEHGHLVLLAMFDCVDDTRLVCKAIIDEFVRSLDEAVVNQYSRKVLLYLLAPRNPMFFHPDIINILTVGDNNTHSKKDTNIRRKELLTYLSAPLLNWLTPNVKKLTTDNNLLLLLSAIVNNVIGDSVDLMKEVASMVAEPFPSTGFHFVDNASGHLVLKKMIMRDVDAMEDNDKENKKSSFAEVLMGVVDGDNVRSWIHCNRGCFVLVSLLERNEDEVTKKINEYLQNCKGTLKKLDTKGAQILLKKLS